MCFFWQEEHNYLHGNITCENIVVEKFTHQVLEVKVTDPGLVGIYSCLPLDHTVNVKR